MYIGDMTVAAKMKPVTVYLQELKYLTLQQMAQEQNRKAAELVRDAMDEYIEQHGHPKKTMESWEPISLGGLKHDAADLASKDFQDEMLGREF